jgi:predicted metal-dependent HD superfamily phosphohydrolase
MQIKITFFSLLAPYTQEEHLISDFWQEITTNYSAKNRHYHTLQHLENLLQQLNSVKSKIQHWETVLFSLYYHDVIYNPLKSDNEAQSAALAAKRMAQIGVPTTIIEACTQQILATKSHTATTDNDTNYFMDADLSVLGLPWEIYSDYYKNVRKEYSIYPNILYNPGRKKVLNHFLSMEPLFKTDFFYTAFEQNAKENLQKELEKL